MEIMYIECNMGASSDMILGALMDLIDDKERIISKLNGIGLPGITIKAYKTQNCGVEGMSIGTKINGHEEAPGHDSPYIPHEIVRLHTIRDMITASGAPMKAKKQAIEIYEMIAEAKAKVQNKEPERVFFHEVGRVDSISEVIGVCMLMEELEPSRIWVSNVCTGKGYTICQRGKLGVPAPLAKKLLEGMQCYEGRIESELCTPTGAALLKYFGTEFGDEPRMKFERTGIGMGKKVFNLANCVRIYLGKELNGEKEPESSPQVHETEIPVNVVGSAVNEIVRIDDGAQTVTELCANIDDMTPEMIAYAQDVLFANGALDVYTTPIGMKKNRSAVKLSCICPGEASQRFAALILKHTTTRGVREALYKRYTLKSETVVYATEHGNVHVKKSSGYGVTKYKIEYEDLARIAGATNRSIKEISDELTAKLNL